ncbi:RING/U-box superfamily protein [Wolffia australiana]
MDSSSSPPPPNPSTVDSARSLLQDLRLRSDNRIRKHMESMDMDLALEVPDTPERFITAQPNEDSRGNPRRGLSFYNRRSLSSSNRVDEERPFRKGRLASSISMPYDTKISHPTKCRSSRRRMPDDIRSGEGENSHLSCSIGYLSSPPDTDSVDVSPGDLGKGTSSINSKEISETCFLGNNRRKGVSSLNEESSSSIRSNPDKGKGVFLNHDPSNQGKIVPEVDVHRKNFGQRRLVRNGLISPVNIAKISNIPGERSEEAPGFASSRELLLPCKNNGENAQINAETGWRSTRSHSGPGNRSLQPSDRRPGHVSDDGRDLFHGVDSLTLTAPSLSARDEDVVDLGHRLPRRSHGGKRKPGGSSYSRMGECSSSRTFSNQPGSSSIIPQDLGRTVIDVDQLPSPAPRTDSDARSQQLISDEILARQLQEQFFNESSLFDAADEVNASVAWSLQQEESGRRSSVRDLSRSRDSSSIAHLNRQFPRRSSQTSRSNSLNHHRATPSARMAQMRRNLRRAMDLETRLDFLEALEVAFTIGDDSGSGFLHLHRDFDANDYEMLLALDDRNNRPSGATQQQINSLPESVIQADNAEEACAICLDAPSVGDVVRHLPCLHKFHKDCIDEWLRRKTSCPICKSGIS